MQLIEYTLENGATILIETKTEDNDGFVPAGNAALVKASETFEKTIAKVKPAATAVVDTFRSIAPDELEIEFGLKLAAEAGVVFSSLKSEANFNVKLTWKGKQ